MGADVRLKIKQTTRGPDESYPLLEVTDLAKYFPVGGGFFHAPRDGSRRSTASAFPSAGEKAWGWWANRDAAKAPWPGWW
jgi:hypothetical protein